MTGIRARAWRGASVAEMPMHEAFFPVVTASKGLLWFSSLPKGPGNSMTKLHLALVMKTSVFGSVSRCAGYGQADLLVERLRSCESAMCKLQMTGNAKQHSKAIPQNPAGPNCANSQPESMVDSAVAPPIPTVP